MFGDHVFAAVDRLDAVLGISAVEEERRRELTRVVHCLAEADRTVAEVRAGMLGPYWGLARLQFFTRRGARAVARAAALNEELRSRFEQVRAHPDGEAIAAVLEARQRLHLEVESELVAGLSADRRAVVESLRRHPAGV